MPRKWENSTKTVKVGVSSKLLVILKDYSCVAGHYRCRVVTADGITV